MDEEMIMRAAEMEQQARGLDENLEIINAQISELEMFKEDLKHIAKSKEKEMLASLGKRVYIKTSIKDSEKLFVDVGAGIIVKKTPEETMEVVLNQIKRLQEARMQILNQLNFYNTELDNFIKMGQDNN